MKPPIAYVFLIAAELITEIKHKTLCINAQMLCPENVIVSS
jgi:hypothetical protein